MEVLINVGLWILWGLPALIVSLIFIFRGAKRGTVPALISVGATLVSGLISWLIAHLIGGAVASGLARFFNLADNMVDLFGSNLPFDLSAVSASANLVNLIDCLLKSVCTVTIFGFLMFLNSIIIKNIVSGIVSKKVTFPAKFSWGGFFISLFDAILLISLIMLPTYGTIGLVRDVQPLAAVLMEQGDEDGEDELFFGDEDEEEDPLATLAKHPLVIAYDSQPLAFVYDSLCSAGLSGSSFSPSGFVRNTANMASKGMPLFETDTIAFGDDTRTFANAFVQWADGNKALKPLLLDIYNSVIGVSDLSKNIGQEGDESTQQLVSLLKGFKDIVTNLLTVDTSAHRNERLDSVEMLSVGIIRLVKNVGSMDGEDLSGMTPMFGAIGNLLEGVARHPAVGVDGVMNVYASLIENLGLAESLPMLTQESTVESIRTTLNTALTKNLSDEFTANFLSTLMETAASFSGTEDVDLSKLLTADPAVLDTIKSMITADALKGMGFDDETAQKAEGVVNALVNTIKNANLTPEEAEKEGALLGSVLAAVSGDGELDDDIQNQLKSSKIVNALANSTELDDETRKMIQDFLK